MASAHNTADFSKAVQGVTLDRLHATLALDEPVRQVRQVSATRAQILERAMHITTVRQLLRAYPHRYVDMSQVVSTQQAQIGQECTIVGSIYEIKQKRPRPRLSLIEISLVDEAGLMMVTCFNQPWLANSLSKGLRISISGKVEFNYGFKRMTNPLIVVHDPLEEVVGVVLPIHPSTSKLSRVMVRRLIHNALERVCGCYDPLPLELRTKYRLYSRYQALRGVHEPVSLADAQAARRRLRYEELFFLELELIEKERARIAGCSPYEHNVAGYFDGQGANRQSFLAALSHSLPFDLTDDQKAAVADILKRMAAPHPMNHLLLGDVGTGKTMVAAFALAACADTGTQAMMMGPTEVLAAQYATSLGDMLSSIGISWGLLTGATSSSQRETLLADFASGAIQVLFGTHALFEPDVQPQRCSLVCIDEQQRFGVEQREALVAKAPGADVLSMTATPIPRSLALALYGGLTLSYLHKAPANQGGRTTKVCHFSEEGIAYDALRETLARGEQAYVICPLIGSNLGTISNPDDKDSDLFTRSDATLHSGVADGMNARSDGLDDMSANPDGSDDMKTRSDESAGLGGEGYPSIEYAVVEWGLEHDEAGATLSAAKTHAEVLQNQVVPQARVGLLHGRMKASEKAQVMEDFRAGKIDVLVSTTVIEVGVDVPNATLMIIEDADRFGLAQLHQLRGRVGRGSKPGQVFLVSRSKSPQALERLRMMEQTEDGFELSEKDLAMRREGDIFGDRQHGASPLALVNVVRDKAMIEAAYADAKACVEGKLVSPEEQSLVERELALLKKARQA